MDSHRRDAERSDNTELPPSYPPGWKQASDTEAMPPSIPPGHPAAPSLGSSATTEGVTSSTPHSTSGPHSPIPQAVPAVSNLQPLPAHPSPLPTGKTPLNGLLIGMATFLTICIVSTLTYFLAFRDTDSTPQATGTPAAATTPTPSPESSHKQRKYPTPPPPDGPAQPDDPEVDKPDYDDVDANLLPSRIGSWELVLEGPDTPGYRHRRDRESFIPIYKSSRQELNTFKKRYDYSHVSGGICFEAVEHNEELRICVVESGAEPGVYIAAGSLRDPLADVQEIAEAIADFR